MDTVISVGFLVFLVIVGIAIIFIGKPDKKLYDSVSKTMKVNGVEIQLTEQEIAQIKKQEEDKKIKEFLDRKNRLIKRIRDDKANTTDIIRKKVLDEILKQEIYTQEDYDLVEFMYNNGSLRSNSEVSYMKRYIATKEQRDNYDTSRHLINVFAFLIPFLVVFIPVVLAIDFALFGVPIGLILGGIAGLIGSAIGHAINVSNAKEYCIADNDPRVIEEKRNEKAAIAGTVASVGATAHYAKKNAKELADVDSWKQMK